MNFASTLIRFNHFLHSIIRNWKGILATRPAYFPHLFRKAPVMCPQMRAHINSHSPTICQCSWISQWKKLFIDEEGNRLPCTYKDGSCLIARTRVREIIIEIENRKPKVGESQYNEIDWSVLKAEVRRHHRELGLIKDKSISDDSNHSYLDLYANTHHSE